MISQDMKTQGELFFKSSQLKKKRLCHIYNYILMYIYLVSPNSFEHFFFFGYLKLIYELMKISILLLFHQYVQI